MWTTFSPSKSISLVYSGDTFSYREMTIDWYSQRENLILGGENRMIGSSYESKIN